MISKASVDIKFYIKFYILVFLTVLFFLWTYRSSYVEYVDFKIYDLFSINFLDLKTDIETITPSVVVIDIDQKSVDRLGQWPWPRIIDAQLIKKISAFNPSSIGIDIIFSQADKSSIVSLQKFYKKYMGFELKIDGLKKELWDNDQILADVLPKYKTILAVYLRESLNEEEQCSYDLNNSYLKNAHTIFEAASMLCNVDKLHHATKIFGFVNTEVDKDGILRRVPLFIRYKGSIIPAFSLANLSVLDKNIKFLSSTSISILGNIVHTNDASQVLLHFYDKKWYKHISAVDILQGSVSSTELTGKIVLIGSSLTGQHDRYLVTTRQMINGVDVHATVIENILNNHLRWQPLVFKTINTILGLIISIAMLFLLRKKAYHLLSVTSVSIFVISFIFAYVCFKYGIYISIGYLWFPLILYYILLGFLMLYISEKEKKLFFTKLSLSHSAALDSMVMVAETKDFETGAHLVRTKEYIKLLANHLKSRGVYGDILTDDYIDTIYRASPLHDIGKVGIPDAILQKPGKLTNDEYLVMQKHPRLGMQIISNAINSYNKNDFLTAAYNIAYYHHERWDGKGYPLGLKANEIPLEARLMAVVDVYDALISKRCYKEAYSFEKSEEILIDGSAKAFDPKIIEAFKDIKNGFREIAKKNW